MKEFQINKFLKLRLENGKTNIYIKGKLFRQCKFLLINIDNNNIESFEDIASIDEAESRLDQSLEEEALEDYAILPEEEFWAHCSNLEAWAIYKYDTRLLHRTLAFPMLKVLTDVGDQVAKAVFEEEIIKRFESGHPTIVQYLIGMGYVRKYVKEKLIETLLESEVVSILKNLEKYSKTEVKIVVEILYSNRYGDPQFAIEFEKKKLIGLELRHCNLTRFPLEITKLTSLKKLFIDDNMLDSVPNEIGRLKNLRELNLNNNQLEALPVGIRSLKSLKMLSIGANKFKVFPEVVTELMNLKLLVLGMNRLTKIPESIRNLENLEILSLNHNQLSELPESVEDLKSLKVLTLKNNKFEAPDELRAYVKRILNS